MKFPIVIAVVALIIDSCCATKVPSVNDAQAVMMGFGLTLVLSNNPDTPGNLPLRLAFIIIQYTNMKETVRKYRTNEKFRNQVVGISLKITNYHSAATQKQIESLLKYSLEARESDVVKLLEGAQRYFDRDPDPDILRKFVNK